MIYALAFGIPGQRKTIDRACFGSCGKIIFGAVELGEYGAFMVCHTKDCPHLDREVLLEGAEANGEPVTLRKLKEEAPLG